MGNLNIRSKRFPKVLLRSAPSLYRSALEHLERAQAFMPVSLLDPRETEAREKLITLCRQIAEDYPEARDEESE